LPRLIGVLSDLNKFLNDQMEAVFVVDGSPDQSFVYLRRELEHMEFSAQLIAHSRNFGSFQAIRTGLQSAQGDYCAALAADLQEPPELLLSFFKSLDADECDVAIGTRNGRNDPFFSRICSGIFWNLYRWLVVREMPPGGVDVFGCNRVFKEHLLKLEESHSSLIALIFWLGFRRKTFSYKRLKREEGKSSWSFRRKLDYMMDSIFSFTDYPIRILTHTGIFGCTLAGVLAVFVVTARLLGFVAVPGYAATMVVVLFFGALNLLGLGLVGTYAWRSYENSKNRPLAVISHRLMNRRKDHVH